LQAVSRPSAEARALFLVLKDHAHPNGHVPFDACMRLTDRFGMGARRHVLELEQAGWVEPWQSGWFLWGPNGG
jgi:hypothetical protein